MTIDLNQYSNITEIMQSLIAGINIPNEKPPPGLKTLKVSPANLHPVWQIGCANRHACQPRKPFAKHPVGRVCACANILKKLQVAT